MRRLTLLAAATGAAFACSGVLAARPGALFSDADLGRPLFGARIAITGDRALDRLALARAGSALDFVVAGSEEQARLCAEAGTKWAADVVVELPFSLSRKSWPDALDKVQAQVVSLRDVPALVCWFVRTKIAPEADLASLTADEASEFGRWLQGRYGDENPAADSNGDGRTANAQLGISVTTWKDIAAGAAASDPALQAAQRQWRQAAREQFLLEAARLVASLDVLRPVVPVWNAGPASGPSLALDPLGRRQGLGISFGAGTQAEGDAGHRAVLKGDSIHSSIRGDTASAFVEWELAVPPSSALSFEYGVQQGSAPGRIVVRVTAGVRPFVLMEEEVSSSSGMQRALVPLGDYAGEKVRLRLEARPLDGRSGEVKAVWKAPAIDAPDQHALLIEPANWWQARIGYRTSLQQGASDVVTGPAGPRFDAATTEALLAAGSAAAEAAGTRLVLMDVHPTGDPSTGSPKSLASMLGRALAYRPAAICIGPADAGDLLPEIGRWRSLLAVEKPYPGIVSNRRITVVADGIDSDLHSLLYGLDRFGYRLASPYRLSDAAGSMVLLASQPSAAMADALEQASTSQLPGRKLLFYQQQSGAPGAVNRPGAVWLPVDVLKTEEERLQPDGAPAVVSEETVKLQLPLEWQEVRAQGRVAGARSKSAAVLFGRPDFASGKAAEEIGSWFGAKADDLDSGWIRIVREGGRVSSQALFSLEGRERLYIPGTAAGWDIIERKPALGEVTGPGCWYSFPRAGARIVELDGAFPESLQTSEGKLLLKVSIARPGASVTFWTAEEPDKQLGATEAWTTEAIGDGFWRARCSTEGNFSVTIPGAAVESGNKRWTPFLDH